MVEKNNKITPYLSPKGASAITREPAKLSVKPAKLISELSPTQKADDENGIMEEEEVEDGEEDLEATSIFQKSAMDLTDKGDDELTPHQKTIIVDFEHFICVQKKLDRLRDLKDSGKSDMTTYMNVKDELMFLLKQPDMTKWSSYAQSVLSGLESIFHVSKRKSYAKLYSKSKLSKGDILRNEGAKGADTLSEWCPITSDFNLKDTDALISAAYGWFFAIDRNCTCELGNEKVPDLLCHIQVRDLKILLESQLLKKFDILLAEHNKSAGEKVKGITPQIFKDNVIFGVTYLLQRMKKARVRIPSVSLAKSPSGVNNEEKYTNRDVSKDTFKWKSKPNVFDWNFLVLGWMLAVEIFALTPLAFFSINNLAGSIFLTVSVLTVIILVSCSSQHMRHNVKSKLAGIPLIWKIVYGSTWLVSLACLYLYHFVLHASAHMMINTSEIIFPYLTRVACMFGSASITIVTISQQSKDAASRDVSLLQGQSISIASDDSIDTSRKLFQLICHYCNVKVDKSTRKHRLLAFGIRFVVHCAGAAIVPILTLLTFFDMDPFTITTFWKASHLGATEKPSLSDINFIIYLLLLATGSWVLITTTFLFEEFLGQIRKTYFTSHTLLSMLLATTLPEDAAMLNLPYNPLHIKGNVHAFMTISNVIRNHYLGSKLGEIASGFAALLLVDVIVVATFVTLYYGTKAEEFPWRAVIGLGYYGILLTVWCLLMLYEATLVHSVHTATIKRLWQIKLDIVLRDKQGDDEGEMASQLEDTRSVLEATYEPLTIFGIQATPTLLQAFLTYIFSAILAILYKFLGI